MVQELQGGCHPHDLCSIKIASNLIVSLLLGGECSRAPQSPQRTAGGSSVELSPPSFPPSSPLSPR